MGVRKALSADSSVDPWSVCAGRMLRSATPVYDKRVLRITRHSGTLGKFAQFSRAPGSEIHEHHTRIEIEI
jgi:hypothetical protein